MATQPTTTKKVTARLPQGIIKAIDNLIKKGLYKSRANYIEINISNSIQSRATPTKKEARNPQPTRGYTEEGRKNKQPPGLPSYTHNSPITTTKPKQQGCEKRGLSKEKNTCEKNNSDT